MTMVCDWLVTGHVVAVNPANLGPRTQSTWSNPCLPRVGGAIHTA